MTTTRGPSLLAPLALLPALLLAACTTSSDPETTLAFIELVPRAVTLPEGGTRKLTAIATYSDGSVLPLTTGLSFSSSEAAKATVSADGTITAVAAGAATIVATASGRTATCAVTVNAPTLQSIAVTPATVSLEAGATQALTVTGTYDFGPTANLTGGAVFSTSDGNRASVSAAGVVTAIATGSATITATIGGKVSTAVVTVLAPTLQSIAVAPASLTLPEGATRALAVTGTYSSGPTQNLTAGASYTTSDAGTATVSAAGVVTAVAPGSATITATVSGRSSSAAVTVTARALQSIAVAPATVTLTEGTTRALAVTGTYDIGPTADFTASATYQTSAASVATVSAAGVVTAVAPGSATITASFSGQTATAAVTVNARVLQSIAVSPAAPNLTVGGTSALTVTATYDVGPTVDVTASATYTSSDNTRATVSTAGLVTAVAAGTATITASFSGQTSTAAVTVTDISPTASAVFVGDFAPGVSFRDFGGAANAVTVDSTPANQRTTGLNSLKAVITGTGAFSGGALATTVPRDLRAFNALTFWAKASTTNTLNVAGIGNDAASNPPTFNAEALTFALDGTWRRFIIPLPDPTKAVGMAGLFHFADGPKNYTIWFSEIQYEQLLATEVGPVTSATVNWPAPTLAVGATSQLVYNPNTVGFTLPALPNAGRLTDVAFSWFTLTSSNPAVATVDATGLITAVAAGTANISATVGGFAVPSQAVVTVTAGGGATAPTTARIPTHAAANVLSMYNSSGTYTDVPIDTWQTTWSQGTLSLHTIAGTSNVVKKYTGVNFVGVEFQNPKINASGFTNFHVDLWTPDATKFAVKLVSFPTAGGAPEFQVELNTTTTPAITTGAWIGIDIPLSAFTGVPLDTLAQLLFIDNVGGVENGTYFIDNVYFWR